jgi:hypothetical protein
MGEQPPVSDLPERNLLGKAMGGLVVACFLTGAAFQGIGLWVSGRPSIYEDDTAAMQAGLEWSNTGSRIAYAGLALIGLWGITELTVHAIKDKISGRKPETTTNSGAVDEI